MSDSHEVISAFLDDEAFDANALAHALSEPAGRELLLDLWRCGISSERMPKTQRP